MKELTTEEMSSLKGGLLDTNFSLVMPVGNVGLAVPVAVNVLGTQMAEQYAYAYAGNQAVSIQQGV
jgi:hypothetical protein